MGANHHQSYQRAMAHVFATQKIGADAIKVQMFEPGGMAEKDGKKLETGLWAGKTLYELYEQAAMPIEWVSKLKQTAEGIGLDFIATVYYPEMVPIAENIGVKIYKISSYELLFDKLIETVAKTLKPLIVSTGSSEPEVIQHAVELVRKYHSKLALLKCCSKYPSSLEDMNLHTILDMRKRFAVPIGLSDHSLGTISPVTAVALGARIIEKHLTLDGKGLDGGFSLLPNQFEEMVILIKATQKALGRVHYKGDTTLHRREKDGKWLRRL